jgi:hypothetical protein
MNLKKKQILEAVVIVKNIGYKKWKSEINLTSLLNGIVKRVSCKRG